MVFTFLVFGAALTLELFGSYISIMGLSKNASYILLGLAITLDFAKIIIATVLYKQWRNLHAFLKYTLIPPLIFLIIFTSSGAYAFLFQEFNKTTSGQEQNVTRIQALEEEKAKLEGRKKEIDGQISRLPPESVVQRKRMTELFAKEIDHINTRTVELDRELPDLKVKNVTEVSQGGTIGTIAKAYNLSPDTITKFLVFPLVVVIDPLAIILLTVANFLVEQRKRDQEAALKKKLEMDALLAAAKGLVVDNNSADNHAIKDKPINNNVLNNNSIDNSVESNFVKPYEKAQNTTGTPHEDSYVINQAVNNNSSHHATSNHAISQDGIEIVKPDINAHDITVHEAPSLETQIPDDKDIDNKAFDNINDSHAAVAIEKAILSRVMSNEIESPAVIQSPVIHVEKSPIESFISSKSVDNQYSISNDSFENMEKMTSGEILKKVIEESKGANKEELTLVDIASQKPLSEESLKIQWNIPLISSSSFIPHDNSILSDNPDNLKEHQNAMIDEIIDDNKLDAIVIDNPSDLSQENSLTANLVNQLYHQDNSTLPAEHLKEKETANKFRKTFGKVSRKDSHIEPKIKSDIQPHIKYNNQSAQSEAKSLESTQSLEPIREDKVILETVVAKKTKWGKRKNNDNSAIETGDDGMKDGSVFVSNTDSSTEPVIEHHEEIRHENIQENTLYHESINDEESIDIFQELNALDEEFITAIAETPQMFEALDNEEIAPTLVEEALEPIAPKRFKKKFPKLVNKPVEHITTIEENHQVISNDNSDTSETIKEINPVIEKAIEDINTDYANAYLQNDFILPQEQEIEVDKMDDVFMDYEVSDLQIKKVLGSDKDNGFEINKVLNDEELTRILNQ